MVSPTFCIPHRVPVERPTAAPDAWSAVHWQGLAFRVPTDWDVVRHSTDAARGRLVFVDRRRQRLELAWTHAPDPLDLGRLLSDHRSAQVVTDGTAALDPWHVAGWSGLSRELSDAGGRLIRAVRHELPAERLLEATLVEPAGEPGVSQRVLASLSARRPSDATRTCLAGVCITTGSGWQLRDAVIQAGSTRFDFRRDTSVKRGLASELTVQRYGFASTLGVAGLHAALRRLVPEPFERIAEVEHEQHEALHATGYEAGPRYRGLLGRLRQRRDLFWRVECDNAFYRVSTLSLVDEPIEPNTFSVTPRVEAGR